jgi:ribonuclease HII
MRKRRRKKGKEKTQRRRNSRGNPQKRMKEPQISDKLERVYLDTRYDYVIGVDEVGRGSWAGPVVVGAFVYRKTSKFILEVNDSKRLTLKRRKEVFSVLQDDEFAIAQAEVDEIDNLNIVEATRLAIKRAVASLALSRAIVLVDGYFKDPFDFDFKCITKGDAKHYSIAAASILAKVHRDDLMGELAKDFPHYGFETNVGYGTRKHREALGKYGVCEIHRKSYKPIRDMLNG